MKIVISKPKKLFLFILSILAIIIISSILAYLTDKEQKQNEFTIGSVDIELLEPTWSSLPDIDCNGIPDAAEALGPNDSISKDPQVKNIGDNDAYVYLKVYIPMATVKVGEQENAINQALFTYTPNVENWVLMENLTINNDVIPDTVVYTYYYRTGSDENSKDYLEAGAITETLFNNVTLVGIKDFIELDLTQQIIVKAYAIQLSEEFTVISNPLIKKFQQEQELRFLQEDLKILSIPNDLNDIYTENEEIVVEIPFTKEIYSSINKDKITKENAPKLFAQIEEKDAFELEFIEDYNSVSIIERNNLEITSRDISNELNNSLKYKYKVKKEDEGNFKIKKFEGMVYDNLGKKIKVEIPTLPKIIEIMQPLYKQISSVNYGDYVSYNISSNNVSINNWRIFYNDGNEVTMIAEDIIEYNAIPKTNPGSGAQLGKNATYRVYWNKTSYTRDSTINELLGAKKSKTNDVWNSFVRSDLKNKAIGMGGTTIQTWVNSWNDFPNQTEQIALSGNDTNGYGVKLGDSSIYTDFIGSNKTAGISNSNDLYFPRNNSFVDGSAYGTTSDSNYSIDGKCYGYALASSKGGTGTFANSRIAGIGFIGSIYSTVYYHSTYGIRPAIVLNSSTFGIKRNGIWEIK